MTKLGQNNRMYDKKRKHRSLSYSYIPCNLQRKSGEVLNGREMAEAFTCWGCIIWRHKLIRPWKSQVSDTIRRRLIKPISHLNGLALPSSLSLFVFVLSIPLSRSFFVLIPIVLYIILFYCVADFSFSLSFFPLRFPREIRRVIDEFVNKII